MEKPRAIVDRPVRPTGYVTQKLIDKHGSFKAALAWLNAQAGVDRRAA